MKKENESIIINVLEYNTELAREGKPWQQFLTTIQRGIVNGQVLIVSTKEYYEANVSKFLGFCKDDDYYFQIKH